MTHDPMCDSTEQSTSTPKECWPCTYAARVRADERNQIAQRLERSPYARVGLMKIEVLALIYPIAPRGGAA